MPTQTVLVLDFYRHQFLLTLFGIRVKRESFDMTSLAPVLFNKAIQQNKSIYFIGTEPDIIADTIKNIKNTYPKLNICGFRHGYFSQDERDIVIKKIFQLAPDYVICGMGTPLQEYFLLDLKKEGWSGEGFTCGGFLHQTANRIIYYPEWINRFGLRAFYRMYDEPKLIKRYFIDYPKAVVFILYDLVRFRLGY